MRDIVLFFFSCIPFLCAAGFQPLSRPIVSHTVSKVEHWTLQASPKTITEEEGFLDAEALLACWAFLKRRKRIGNWTNAERRKAAKESTKPSFLLGEDDDYELLMDGDEEYEEDEEEYDAVNFDNGGRTSMDGENEIIIETEDVDLNPDKWFGDFTSFPMEPTTTRMRRSNSAKKLWKDPEFRQRWQESRWGKKRSKKDKHQREVQSRVRQLPREFWGSDELASMTKEEINMAIESYVSGRKKRSASTKKTLKERKKECESSSSDSGDERVARNTLFAMDPETLKEQQRLRSERAKARYQTRLDNEQKKKKSKSKPKEPARKQTYLPSGSTPQDAILRILAKLDENEYPAVNDLTIIMVPQKLGKRRYLLKRILLELFELRGKCVPSDLDDELSDKLFVTKARIEHLGDFVIRLLQKRAEEEGEV